MLRERVADIVGHNSERMQIKMQNVRYEAGLGWAVSWAAGVAAGGGRTFGVVVRSLARLAPTEPKGSFIYSE